MPLSPTETRALLARLGLTPRRRLGQNFLVDGNIVRKSLEMAGVLAGETVVEAVELAHLYDARAYLALNTLLKDAEVEPALAALEAPYLAGLDALIVADLGFAVRVREELPGLPLHASTQAGTHSSSQLAALADEL